MKTMKMAIVLTLAMAVSLPIFAGEGNEELLEQLKAMMAKQAKMEKQLKDQQDEIRQLKGDLEKEPAGYAQVKDAGPVLKLKPQTDRFEVSGDLRVRYEQIETNNDDVVSPAVGHNDELRQFRHRFRLGMKWVTKEGWEVAAGLATGGTSGTSTNYTWNTPTTFSTGDIRLDYAYATHSWKGIKLTVGQQKNPYMHAGVLFDGDVRPTGVSLQSDIGPGFVTIGGYNVASPGANDELGFMYAAQAGIKTKRENGPNLTAAIGYYGFNDEAAAEAGASNNNEFRIGDVYLKLDVPLGKLGVSIYGQASHNFGAHGQPGDGQSYSPSNDPLSGISPTENDDAFVVGIDVKIGKLKLGYKRVKIESDAYFNPIKDADYQIGNPVVELAKSDIQGHAFKASYSVTKNFSVNGTVYLLEREEQEDPQYDSLDHYRIDLLYKF